MAQTRSSRETELHPTNAYFEMVMNPELHEIVPDSVLKDPEFWEYLESTRPEPDREEWAEETLKRMVAKGRLYLSEETREADKKTIAEGGVFLFLRNLCSKMGAGEEEVEVWNSGEEADDEGPAINSQDSKRSGLSDLVTEQKPLTPAQYLGVVGMSEQDIRAQRVERWLSDQEKVDDEAD